MTNPAEQALDLLASREADFASVLEEIYKRRHTGGVWLHCVDGVPKVVEFPGVQVRLTGGSLDTSEKITEST